MNSLLAETRLPSGIDLQLVQGDITAEKTDAIVNAANEYLQHGAGVAGAIVRRGGQAIVTESDAWVRKHGLVSHESPAWTSGGYLPAKYVIHAVGPIWGEGDEDARLTDAVTGSLRVADELKIASIAFPALSTGIFGFPKERASNVIVEAILKYLYSNDSGIQTVRIVVYDGETLKAFEKSWNDHFGPKP